MKKHRIFNKGNYVYCLLSSHTRPNVQIPVKGLIIDTKWDQINPKYQIRILKFYDTMRFLKQNFFDVNFYQNFDSRKARHIPLKSQEFTNVQVLEKRLNEDDREKFYVIVDSIMCTKTRVQLQDLFNRVQLYIISKNLKEIKTVATRPFYRGSFSVDSKKEFDKRFAKGWEDKIVEPLTDIESYLKSLD